MTAELWQRSAEHIKFAQELFQQPKFRDILAVLTNSRPNIVVSPILDPTRVAVDLGRLQGYGELLKVIFALPMFPSHELPDLQADYSAEDTQSAQPLGMIDSISD